MAIRVPTSPDLTGLGMSFVVVEKLPGSVLMDESTGRPRPDSESSSEARTGATFSSLKKLCRRNRAVMRSGRAVK